LHEAILLRREDVNGTTLPIAVTQPLRGEIDELLWNIKTVIQKTSLSRAPFAPAPKRPEPRPSAKKSP